MELAHAFEPVQDGRIHIEKINAPFLYQLKGTPVEYKAGLERAIANGWLWFHESGTYVKFTETGAARCSADKELNTQFSGCSGRGDKNISASRVGERRHATSALSKTRHRICRVARLG